MGFLTSIIEALVRFVRRHPLTTLIIVLLPIGAPALARGMLWFFLGLLAVVAVVVLVFFWRIRAVQQEMKRQFGEGFGTRPGAGGFGSPFGTGAQNRAQNRTQNREGEVKIHRTPGAPDKRVSSDVGDYVDFEETEE